MTVNLASFQRHNGRQFVATAKSGSGPDKLNAALDRAQAAADAVDGDTIRDAVAKAIKPHVEAIAQAEKDQHEDVIVHKLFKLPTETPDKPEQNPCTRGYALPKGADDE